MPLNLPRRSYDDLRGEAEGFLAKYHPARTIPVPIEGIIENDFLISIIPIPGLLNEFEIDGFISSNLEAISIDEFIYMRRERRARFTLAHELSHLILHRDIISKRGVATIDQYRRFLGSIEDNEYRWLEWQARCLAGLILAPSQHLRDQLIIAQDKAGSAGLDTTSEPAVEYICESLSNIFNVSTQTIQYRLTKEGLISAEFPPELDF